MAFGDCDKMAVEQLSLEDKVYIDIENVCIDEEAGVLISNGVNIPISDVKYDKEGVYIPIYSIFRRCSFGHCAADCCGGCRVSGCPDRCICYRR